MVAILTFVAGILVTHVYYQLSNRSANRLAKKERELIYKLPARVVRAIQSAESATLTVPELNDLLRKLTFDETQHDVLGYKACPSCGSKGIREIEKAIIDGDRDGIDITPVRVLKCDCGWETDELTASGLTRPPLV